MPIALYVVPCNSYGMLISLMMKRTQVKRNQIQIPVLRTRVKRYKFQSMLTPKIDELNRKLCPEIHKYIKGKWLRNSSTYSS